MQLCFTTYKILISRRDPSYRSGASPWLRWTARSRSYLVIFR